MKTSGYHILRVGLGITFFWIGILIFKDPEGWGAMIQPWALDLLPAPVKTVMLSTAAMDMVIGFFLLIDVWTWLFALVGAIHMVVVLTTTGINAITVRDIGILSGLLAVTVSKLPDAVWKKFRKS
jgi:uncharacterized membrane protein YphA (DoxX/SURF4 family)